MSEEAVSLLRFGIITAVVLWLFYLMRPGRDIDSRNVYSCFQRGWRRLVFWAGSVCLMKHFPWLTWDKHGYKASYEELMYAFSLARAGDVGLTYKWGYFLSNSAIPGLFKHALIFVRGPVIEKDLTDVTKMRIVEAVAEGVLGRHPLNARADYIMILRPKEVTGEDIVKAVKTAEKIVGSDYDADFKFDIEEEVKELQRKKTGIVPKEAEAFDEDVEELQILSTNLAAEYDHAFSCTETVAAAWWHKRHPLRLYRQKSRGRQIIVADQFINRGFQIVWTNVPVELARKSLGEEATEMVEEYWGKTSASKES